jgi:hypothetical protein
LLCKTAGLRLELTTLSFEEVATEASSSYDGGSRPRLGSVSCRRSICPRRRSDFCLATDRLAQHGGVAPVLFRCAALRAWPSGTAPIAELGGMAADQKRHPRARPAGKLGADRNRHRVSAARLRAVRGTCNSADSMTPAIGAGPPYRSRSSMGFSLNSDYQRSASITSSARSKAGVGISMPSDFAVLRLRTVSMRVDCCTGRSPGLSPLRMRPT